MSRFALVACCLLPGVLLAGPDGSTANDSGKPAASRVTGVTVYRSSALVTREVEVPEGTGAMELVVAGLPPQTVDSSLYSEGTDGLRVLATRARTRAVREDTREEVRKLDAQIKEQALAAQRLQSESKTLEQNLAMLGKLEGFTGATMQQLTEKGMLSAETTIALSKYIMDTRSSRAKELVEIQQQLLANQEQTQFLQRQRNELAKSHGKVERDAVIVLDKKNNPAGKVRLNYLVNTASWRPQYKLRAGKEREPVQVEYLAAVEQNTGEDWTNVSLVLSTAQPMLNASPPDLKALEVAAVPGGVGRAAGGMAQTQAPLPPGMPVNPGAGKLSDYKQMDVQSKNLRAQSAQEFNRKNWEGANTFINEAAALEQARELIAQRDEQKLLDAELPREGPSVTYHLGTRLSVPSRNDEQVIQVARLEFTPEYYYKAVPVLTQHVYRLANLTNKSEFVLLPGEATMYLGTDFVGRGQLPLVAIGEQFTAGFGADPQLQVQRRLLDKAQTTQGGNQVLKYDYRILVQSYKAEPVKVQVWDRLPHAETQNVVVTLVSQKPEISKDGLYLREERPKNLLRWDVTVDPNMSGEKALAINYEFKIELDRQMMITGFTAK